MDWLILFIRPAFKIFRTSLVEAVEVTEHVFFPIVNAIAFAVNAKARYWQQIGVNFVAVVVVDAVNFVIHGFGGIRY